MFSSSFSGTFLAFFLVGPPFPSDLFLLSPSVTFSAGSVEDALDLRLPADLKNRLRTVCLPGPGPAAVEPPDADFPRGIAVCRRAGLLGARARGRTFSRLRARTPQPVRDRPWGRSLSYTNRMRGGPWWGRGLSCASGTQLRAAISRQT